MHGDYRGSIASYILPLATGNEIVIVVIVINTLGKVICPIPGVVNVVETVRSQYCSLLR